MTGAPEEGMRKAPLNPILMKAGLMGRSSTSIPRRGPILTAAIMLALVWAGVFVVGHFVLESHVAEVVGVVGLVLTCIVIGVVGHRQAAELHGLAQTDPLTGLRNHRGFHESLELELALARRENEQLSLVTIDLDDFKAVNDAHGHPYGDEVLRGVGSALRSSVREGDTAARVGGEEFALILPGTPSDAAYSIAERARAGIARVAVHGLELSCSAGIATYPADAEDASTLYQLADGALYWAKSAGKQRTRRFDPQRVKRSLNQKQSDEIKALLENPGGVRPVFQPVVALSTGRLVGYEALARFPGAPARPTPAWFAMAHACGLGPGLEATAIRAALEPIGRPPGTHLAVNVSPSVLLSAAVQEALPDDLTRDRDRDHRARGGRRGRGRPRRTAGPA